MLHIIRRILLGIVVVVFVVLECFFRIVPTTVLHRNFLDDSILIFDRQTTRTAAMARKDIRSHPSHSTGGLEHFRKYGRLTLDIGRE